MILRFDGLAQVTTKAGTGTDFSAVVSKISESAEKELSQLVPMYAYLAKTSKLPLLQSIISTILVEMVFDAYFVGLSKDQANKLKQTEECLAVLSKLYIKKRINQTADNVQAVMNLQTVGVL